MNKRANLYLNIIGSISFILSLLIIGISLKLETRIYHIPSIVSGIVALIGMIIGLIFIGVEVFLFLLMKNKERFLEIGYMSIELILAVLLNSKVPYAFYIVFTVFNIGRNLLRIYLVDKIYRPKEFNRYCKMFGIKIKDFPKKKTTTVKKNVIDIPVDNKVYNKKTKTSKKHAEAASI